jgi:phage tail-like protein
MAIYGVDYYGAAYYGANNLVQFNAYPFSATPYDYASIQLSWTTPTGDWDYLRLVRNSYGFPVTADDGDVLFEDAKATSRTFFNDNGSIPNNVGLKPAHPYYYSIFARETTHSTWQIAGTAVGVSVKDYNTNETMFNYLPSILTSQVPYDSALDESNDFLKRFLKLFALNLDLYKSQTENVINRYDITSINGLLIPVFMHQFGLRYEPELGLKQSRILLNNAIRLYKNKGSKLGVEEYVKAYAGYDNSVSMSKNLMLDQNDSSFEQSIGSWASVSNCTLARHSATDSPSIAPYNEVQSNATFPNLQAGTLQVTGTASGTAEFSLSGDTPIHYGIPVTAGSTYTFSGYARAGTTARNVQGKLYWYSSTGVLISSSSTGTGVADTAGSWHQFKVSQAAPSGAYFCVPHILIPSTVNTEKHYFDCLQFELGSSATYFKEARQIEITLVATRVNEVVNPNFETSTNHWSINNGTLTLSSTEVEADADAPSVALSGGSVEIYPVATGLVTLTSDAMSVLAGNDYAFSMYFYESAMSHAVTPFISWYDNSNTLVSTVNGTALTSSGGWTRVSIVSSAPITATTAKVGIKWTATSTSNEMYVDAALFEKSSFINSFFDGSNGVAQKTDLFWEGATNASRSHYYLNRFAVQSRLISTLPNWINVGSTFELLFAQPS